MKTASILSVAGFIATASAALGKTPWLDELGPSLNAGLGANLPFKAATGNNEWTKSIPQVCQETTISRSECKPSEMEVFGVTYPDCAQPWVMCRCTKSPMTFVPPDPSFRSISSLYHIIAASKPSEKFSGNCLYTSDLRSAMSCPSPSPAEAVAMPMHSEEISSSLAIAEASPLPRSSCTKPNTILPAVKSDTCVPDNYANTNQAEDFAQLMVVHAHKLVAGSLPKSTDCMKNQMNVMARDWPASTLWPATCDLSVKPPNSPSVTKADPVSVASVASAEFVPVFPEGVHMEDFGVVG
ncbi:hypothetical protein C7212DRAFT_367168 [Tuber magnatum]|uniref:Uncharacterized protein n=1 Tax=Tuber magnatum TaxID=42249 RepID=A0A317SB08_9PEZI|nr:hypothetical protein C7212DRAFT_367168 [Tuber magnatum]